MRYKLFKKVLSHRKDTTREVGKPCRRVLQQTREKMMACSVA